jgi:hypothetical protein
LETKTPEAVAAPYNDDLQRILSSIDRGDRLMYQADNFSDRTEYALAKEAAERTVERMRRLASYFEITRDRTAEFSEELEAVVEHVGETLLPGWDVERDVKDE